MFGCAVLLASDASFARPRGRMSSPPKPAAVQPAKTVKPATVRPSTRVTAQPQKSGAAEPQKPFAAAPRPSRSTFISINPRPFAAAPVNRGMHDGVNPAGALQYDPSLGLVNRNGPTPPEGGAATQQASAAQAMAKGLANEPVQAQPLSSSLRLAAPWTPTSGESGSATSTLVCYVQRSGACEPF
jgi:hypothetical protein